MELIGSDQATQETYTLDEQTGIFLAALAAWKTQILPLTWQELSEDIHQGHVGVLCVDMVNGFCHEGALSSPRIEKIIPAVSALFNDAHTLGVRDFLLAQDYHPADAVEFANFPPHCQVGTVEAECIPELLQLPFANLYTIVRKNSLNVFHESELVSWLEEHSQLSTIIVVGNCTDLCVYQAAMHIKLAANARNKAIRVIVPENAVQTYDMPVAVAHEVGAMPHNGDFLHLMFLYHMALNGIEVVKEISH